MQLTEAGFESEEDLITCTEPRCVDTMCNSGYVVKRLPRMEPFKGRCSEPQPFVLQASMEKSLKSPGKVGAE